MGRGGPACELYFLQVGRGLRTRLFRIWVALPDIFIKHDVGALQGQENQNLSKNCCLWKGKTDHNIVEKAQRGESKCRIRTAVELKVESDYFKPYPLCFTYPTSCFLQLIIVGTTSSRKSWEIISKS